MGEIGLGDLFRDVRPPIRRWRVASLGHDVLELVCIEKPGLRRFQTADKLLDHQLYAPERAAVVVADAPPGDVAPEAIQPVRKVMIVLFDGRAEGAARLGAAIARSLAAEVRLALVQTTSNEAPCSIVASDSERARLSTEARIKLGLNFATPALWEAGPVAEAVARAAKACSPDLIVLGDGDGALVDNVLERTGRAVLVAPND